MLEAILRANGMYIRYASIIYFTIQQIVMYETLKMKSLCFVGNALVLITIARFMDSANVTNIFIINLSASDILVIIFCSVSWTEYSVVQI